MVQQRIVVPLFQPRRTGDDDHGRFLGIGAGNRVAEAQATHAVRDTNRPHPVNSGVSIGRKAGAVLASRRHDFQLTAIEHRVELQDVIARNAEHVADAIVLQSANEVLADRESGGCGGCRRTLTLGADECAICLRHDCRPSR